jgi:hypothetical protein
MGSMTPVRGPSPKIVGHSKISSIQSDLQELEHKLGSVFPGFRCGVKIATEKMNRPLPQPIVQHRSLTQDKTGVPASETGSSINLLVQTKLKKKTIFVTKRNLFESPILDTPHKITENEEPQQPFGKKVAGTGSSFLEKLRTREAKLDNQRLSTPSQLSGFQTEMRSSNIFSESYFLPRPEKIEKEFFDQSRYNSASIDYSLREQRKSSDHRRFESAFVIRESKIGATQSSAQPERDRLSSTYLKIGQRPMGESARRISAVRPYSNNYFGTSGVKPTTTTRKIPTPRSRPLLTSIY